MEKREARLRAILPLSNFSAHCVVWRVFCPHGQCGDDMCLRRGREFCVEDL